MSPAVKKYIIRELKGEAAEKKSDRARSLLHRMVLRLFFVRSYHREEKKDLNEKYGCLQSEWREEIMMENQTWKWREIKDVMKYWP